MTRYKGEKGALFVLFLDLQVETRVTQKNSDNNSELVVLDLEVLIFLHFSAHTFGEKLREDIFIAVVILIAGLCEIQGRVCC